jgi:Fe-S cluster assembly ATP-binding protein
MTNIPLIKIKDLSVSIDDKQILSNLSLDVNTNSISAIMGPNGSGKSTLSKVLARHPDYKIINGTVLFEGKNLLEFTPEECAWQGIFLSFQYPVSIPGISNIQFLKTAINAVRRQQNKPTYDAMDFLKLVKEKLKSIDLAESFLTRSLNDGFSGGEKKRNEILQMLLLEPKFVILDETDSGLDIDALKVIAKAINSMRGK